MTRHHYYPAIMLFLIPFLIGGCRTEILSDLSEREASRIIQELRLRGIEAYPSDSGKQRHTISVESAHTAEATRIASFIKPLLVGRGQPEKPPGILSGPDQERLYLTRQLANQLEESLQLLPSVLAARVNIAVAPHNALDNQPEKSPDPGSASVLVITATGSQLSSRACADFIARGTTIPTDRIHVILSSIPDAQDQKREIQPTTVTGGAQATTEKAFELPQQRLPTVTAGSTDNEDSTLLGGPHSNSEDQQVLRKRRVRQLRLIQRGTRREISEKSGLPSTALGVQSTPNSLHELPSPSSQTTWPSFSAERISLRIALIGAIAITFGLYCRLRARSLRLAFRHLS